MRLMRGAVGAACDIFANVALSSSRLHSAVLRVLAAIRVSRGAFSLERCRKSKAEI